MRLGAVRQPSAKACPSPTPFQTPVIPGRRALARGAPESRFGGNSQIRFQAKTGSIQTRSASTPSEGITRKVWIPGPRGLKPPPRNDTQWVFELTTPGTPAGYNAKMPKAARTGDGRRWLQPPYPKTPEPEKDDVRSASATGVGTGLTWQRKTDRRLKPPEIVSPWPLIPRNGG